MKSLASVTFSFLLLASVSLFPAYAQDTASTQKPAVAEEKPVAAKPDSAKEGVPADSDASIEDILAGVDEGDEKTEPEKAAGDVQADKKPEDVKKVDPAGDAKKGDAVEKDVKVEEPSGEALQTEKQAVAEEKQAQEQKKEDVEKTDQTKTDDKSVEKTADEQKAADSSGDMKKEEKSEEKVAVDEGKSEGATEPADEEELQLFEKPESMELGEKMPAETKELELPGDAAAAAGMPAEGATGCIRPAGEPEEVIVPEVCDYVDIHTRRIAYREKARILRDSLEKRRISFERPHYEALEKHRLDIERIDAEDSVAYQKALGQQDSSKKKGGSHKAGGEESVADGKDVPEGYDDIDELSPEELDKKFAGRSKPKFFNPKEAYKKAQEKAKDADTELKKDADKKVSVDEAKKDAAADPHVGLKEKEMPAEQDVEGNTVKNKKVVVPEDAPEFDPSLIQ